MTWSRRAAAFIGAAVLASGCGGTVEIPAAPGPAGDIEAREPCAERNPRRNVYYGDLHVHTTLSFDAHIWETRTTPEEAYRFAKGEPIGLAPLDASGQRTRLLSIDRPLDFAAVTDHSEYLGEVEMCSTPGLPGYDSSTCRQFRAGGIGIYRAFGSGMAGVRPRFRDVCAADGAACRQVASAVWQRVQDAAEAAYDRTSACSFTSFVAYEYTSTPGGSNMHRNIIFRDDNVSFPISHYDQPNLWNMWRELRASCTDAGTGCDAIAIPHNSNESNGNTFFVEYPGAATREEERELAEFRVAMEPLVEVFQHKGDSECMNGLSGVVGEPDELCEFEKRPRAQFEDCGDGRGIYGATGGGCFSRLDFVRNALLAGLKESERLGVNPLRLGLIGSTDTHNGTPGAVAEPAFVGHGGLEDAAVGDRMALSTAVGEGQIKMNPGGLAAVWAEENSRFSLFAALKRRETFATSGTRIAVRFFGGWGLDGSYCADPRMVEKAYAAAVPMGGTLAAAPRAGAAPAFLVSALRDAGTAERPGTKLQRIQIVKGWIDGGQMRYEVFDVAGSASAEAGVDLDSCEPYGPGADALCAVWADPGFDPSQQAYYYARVLENPTCRWSTHTCNALAPEQRPPACADPSVPKTIQERAWSSPIWYAP